MQLKQVDSQEILTNLLFKSKCYIEGDIRYDYKLNYEKVYHNPQEFELSYVDALANLEQINVTFKNRFHEKNIHYNFFLDDSDDPSVENALLPDQYEKYLEFFEKGSIFAYTLKDTWTKGKQFFFVHKGTILKLTKIYEDHIFADVNYKGQTGLMKFSQLKIVLPDDIFDDE